MIPIDADHPDLAKIDKSLYSFRHAYLQWKDEQGNYHTKPIYRASPEASRWDTGEEWEFAIGFRYTLSYVRLNYDRESYDLIRACKIEFQGEDRREKIEGKIRFTKNNWNL